VVALLGPGTSPDWWLHSCRAALVISLLGGALALAYARVASGLHTTAQVVVGLGFGAASAVAWWVWGDALVPVLVLEEGMAGPWRAWKALGVAAGVVAGLSVQWNSRLRLKTS
jgi:hypothetical protein